MNSDRSNTGIATLAKLKSGDGFWEVESGVEVGKAYVVDLDSRRIEQFTNTPTVKDFSAIVIDVINDDGEWERFPIELLELAEPEPQPVQPVEIPF